MFQINEPNQNSRFNESEFKKLMGGDKVLSRKLFGNFITLLPFFSIFMYTNYLPECSGNQEMLDRMVIINLQKHFCSYPNDNNERLIDHQIEDKIYQEEELQYFISEVINEAYDFLVDNNLHLPNEIINNLSEYKETVNSK